MTDSLCLVGGRRAYIQRFLSCGSALMNQLLSGEMYKTQ